MLPDAPQPRICENLSLKGPEVWRVLSQKQGEYTLLNGGSLKISSPQSGSGSTEFIGVTLSDTRENPFIFQISPLGTYTVDSSIRIGTWPNPKEGMNYWIGLFCGACTELFAEEISQVRNRRAETVAGILAA